MAKAVDTCDNCGATQKAPAAGCWPPGWSAVRIFSKKLDDTIVVCEREECQKWAFTHPKRIKRTSYQKERDDG